MVIAPQRKYPPRHIPTATAQDDDSDNGAAAAGRAQPGGQGPVPAPRFQNDTRTGAKAGGGVTNRLTGGCPATSTMKIAADGHACGRHGTTPEDGRSGAVVRPPQPRTAR